MAAYRHIFCLALALPTLFLAPSGVAHADHRPVIVVPGRSDVPVFINGVEASGAVVTGEWGLYRAGHVAAVIYPDPLYLVPVRLDGYFPSEGRRPRYGRQEIDNREARPARAKRYYRAWSAASDRFPVETRQRSEPPEVILAPEFHRDFSK